MAQGKKVEMDLRVAEVHPAAEESAASEDARALEWLIAVARRKFFILTFVAAAAVLSLLISFLLPARYTANTKLLPPQQSQSIGMSAVMNQLGPLSQLIGGGMGFRNSSDFYIGILRSRSVTDGLIDRFGLMGVYNKKMRDDARLELASRTDILSSKDGVISIFVEDRDPQRAADIANGYADELEKLTKTLAVTEAGRRRIFFERETKLAGDELAAAEQGLKETQEKTGLILLDSQSKAMIDALTSVRARVAAQEVVVRSMSQSFATDQNPDLVRARQELAALRDQEAKLEFGQGKKTIANVAIENVPAVGLEYVRKLREVKYREALFELLAKQYEVARIDEGRDSVLIQQLDKALRPERRSWPKRLAIVVFSFLAAFVLSVAWVLFGAAMRRAQEDPHIAAKFHLLRLYMQAGPKD
jgi:uncharacterized protein involved in exopolysaccharide biosynthesis